MAKEYNRTKRVAQEVQKKIAIILQREIENSRIGMATVSRVTVSRDLAHAKVFVTFLNDNTYEQVKIGISVLQDTASFIRSLLGKVMRLRIVPELTFAYDNLLVESMRITNLLSQIIQNDYLRHDRIILENNDGFGKRKTTDEPFRF